MPIFPTPTGSQPTIPITSQPRDVSVVLGATAEFTVSGGDEGPKIFNWLKQGGPLPSDAEFSYIPLPGDPGWTGIPGGSAPMAANQVVRATTSTLTLPNVQNADLGFYYCVVIELLTGQGQSNAAELSLSAPDTSGGTPATGGDPLITSQPPDAVAIIGSTLVLAVTATGTAPLTHQWSELVSGSWTALTDTGAYSGTATATLTLNVTSAAVVGTYRCGVTSAVGHADSRNIAVTIAPALGTGSVGALGNPVYSGGATAFAAFFSGTFSTAGVIYDEDGQWMNAEPEGMMWPEFPFAGEGDIATVICKQRYMQRAQFFSPVALGTACSWNPSLLLLDESDFKLLDGGIVSWLRTYATLPAPRDVFESYAYGFQYLTSTSDSVKLVETVFEVSSRVHCEYFLVKDRASFPPLLYPKYLQLADKSFFKRGQGELSPDATYGAFIVSTDAEILAEDSKERIWKYPFMERRSRYIAGPTLDFWGTSINLPQPKPPASS